MIKHILTLILFASPFFAYSQKEDNITINDKKYLTILFDSNVVNAIVGNKDYIFDLNPDNEDNFILIKAKSSLSKESSLIVKTFGGYLYNLNVSYGATSKNIIQILPEQGIKLSQPNINNKVSFKDNSNTNDAKTSIRENDYTIGTTVINDSQGNSSACDFCDKLLKNPKNVKRIFDEKYKIKVQINNLYYSDNKLYFIIQISNQSNIDYNINYIKSYIDMKSNADSSSAQYLEKNPNSIFNSQRTIKGNTNRSYIFVYDQFTVDNNKHLTFEINENNGERNLFLKIPAYLINNPLNIKNLN